MHLGVSDLTVRGRHIYSHLSSLIKDTASQKRAREEIDSLYDEDTLPKWDDEQNMPFVRAGK
jgi:hypothetical protein